MTITEQVSANRSPKSRPPPTAPGRADHEHGSAADAVLPAVVPIGLPAPTPQSVQHARAYLTPRHATGVDGLLWETRERPMPDRAAIDAVIAAGDRARRDSDTGPEPVEVAAALLLLSAVRLDLDQTEARLLNTAQASGMGFDQIAAILDLDAATAEERHRRLEPRLAEPAAAPPPPPPAARRPCRPWKPARDQPVWDELDEDDWGR